MANTIQQSDNLRFQVIPRVLIFLFDSRQRVLLLKGAKEKRLYADLYNGVGGHIEAHEDLLSGAERELLEETGVRGVELWLCGQIMVTTDAHHGIALFVFKDIDYSGEVQSSAEGTLSWLDLSQLETLELVEDLPILIPRVHRHERGQPVFFGYYAEKSDGGLEMVFR